MNEIKFRSFNEESEEFNYFDLLGDFDDHSYYLLGNENVEQFTGLTDKNGVDIYEGDVVQWIHNYGDPNNVRIGFVEWDEEYAGFGINEDGQEHCLDWNHAIEIIGNVHQSPELLNDS